jgi:hypothetical protein
MSPEMIDAIIQKFGGQQRLGDAIKADQSTVAHWKRRKGIPRQQIERILAEARKRSIDLTPDDFFAPPPVAQPAPTPKRKRRKAA